jgi:NDP-sugar pyrophosphorylase family protein
MARPYLGDDVRMLVGLVPAAGHARRLGPQPASKEVLPVRGRPVMDFLFDRLRAARPDRIRVITRPAKQDVAHHARKLGAELVLGEPPDVAQSLLLGLVGLDPDDEVLVGFPDSIWEPPDGFARLVALLRDGGHEVALGLFRAPDPERSDVVVLGAQGLVCGVEIKPPEPASDLIWGCCAARASALAGLERQHEPGLLFDALAAEGRVAGLELSDQWTDVGTPEALREASG